MVGVASTEERNRKKWEEDCGLFRGRRDFPHPEYGKRGGGRKKKPLLLSCFAFLLPSSSSVELDFPPFTSLPSFLNMGKRVLAKKNS